MIDTATVTKARRNERYFLATVTKVKGKNYTIN